MAEPETMTEKQGIEAAIDAVHPLMKALRHVDLLAAGRNVCAGMRRGHTIAWMHWTDMQRAVLETN